jgi:hypothetical protein
MEFTPACKETPTRRIKGSEAPTFSPSIKSRKTWNQTLPPIFRHLRPGTPASLHVKRGSLKSFCVDRYLQLCHPWQCMCKAQLFDWGNLILYQYLFILCPPFVSPWCSLRNSSSLVPPLPRSAPSSYFRIRNSGVYSAIPSERFGWKPSWWARALWLEGSMIE